MLRATAWTVGLFGTGTAISRTFASGWTEPLVLLALGVIFLFVSRMGATDAATAPRAAPGRRAQELGLPASAHRPQAPAVATPVQPIALRAPPAPVPVPVEQSA